MTHFSSKHVYLISFCGTLN